MWYEKAIQEAPYLRDPYVELALTYDLLKNYPQVEKYCLEALKITSHQKTYINELFSWNETIYDILSLSYYYQGKYLDALNTINKALEINPNDERLKKNKEYMINKVKNLN